MPDRRGAKRFSLALLSSASEAAALRFDKIRSIERIFLFPLSVGS
jgi:hypothetical protein